MAVICQDTICTFLKYEKVVFINSRPCIKCSVIVPNTVRCQNLWNVNCYGKFPLIYKECFESSYTDFTCVIKATTSMKTIPTSKSTSKSTTASTTNYIITNVSNSNFSTATNSILQTTSIFNVQTANDISMKSAAPVGAIVGGVLTCMMILALIVIIIACFRQKKKLSKSMQNPIILENDNSNALYDNYAIPISQITNPDKSTEDIHQIYSISASFRDSNEKDGGKLLPFNYSVQNKFDKTKRPNIKEKTDQTEYYNTKQTSTNTNSTKFNGGPNFADTVNKKINKDIQLDVIENSKQICDTYDQPIRENVSNESNYDFFNSTDDTVIFENEIYKNAGSLNNA